MHGGRCLASGRRERLQHNRSQVEAARAVKKGLPVVRLRAEPGRSAFILLNSEGVREEGQGQGQACPCLT